MSDETKRVLEERWKLLWDQGEDLKERQAKLLSSLGEIEEAVYKRAEEQLLLDRRAYERDLLELRAQMSEHGGFNE